MEIGKLLAVGIGGFLLYEWYTGQAAAQPADQVPAGTTVTPGGGTVTTSQSGTTVNSAPPATSPPAATAKITASAAAIQAAAGNPSAGLSCDSWNFFLQQVTGKQAPDALAGCIGTATNPAQPADPCLAQALSTGAFPGSVSYQASLAICQAQAVAAGTPPPGRGGFVPFSYWQAWVNQQAGYSVN